MSPDTLTVDEPLSTSAPLFEALARTECPADCRYYHGLWQPLRLLGLGATLGGHPDRFHAALADIFAQWQPSLCHNAASLPTAGSVLIAGAADYSMLAHVIDAAGPLRQRVDITVLDRCPTPLRMNEWYARRQGLDIQVRGEDILSVEPGLVFDVIVTSSFLGYFTPEQRVMLFQTLARLLKPGGRFISSNRLRPASPHVPLPKDELASRAFAEKVASLQDTLPQACRSHGDLYQRAYEYAQRRRPYPLNDTETLKALARHAGLAIERLEILTGARRDPDISGPTLQDGSPYAFFVMRKPA